jgi:predicted GIY-YIG superfamily endonuclease
MANKFYVYKWVDNNDNILYVGKTNDIDRRRKQHMSDKEWIDKSTILYYAELSNKTDMDIYLWT